MENRAFTKDMPPKEMLLWQFTGSQNIFLTEGGQWKRHSKVVRAALQKPPPISTFNSLAYKLFHKIGEGGIVKWSDYTHRFTLDAVGLTVLGYDFDALDHPDSPFVAGYHRVMSAIASPAYIFIPTLEKWLPRRKVKQDIQDLRNEFKKIVEFKKENSGNDMITFMLQEPEFTDIEHLDNVVVLFMGGHVRRVLHTGHTFTTNSIGYHCWGFIDTRILPCTISGSSSPGSSRSDGHPPSDYFKT